MLSTKTGAARLTLILVSALVALKVSVAIITGSISILAQSLDSFLDLLAIITTFLAIRTASKPADQEHPFGHGKIEGLAAIGQAVLLFAASGGLVYSAIYRMITGETISYTLAGVGVMLVSMLVSIFLSRHLQKVARATTSLALDANARNISADVYSSAGVLVGLLVVYFTGLTIIDPIIALVVALFIVRAAVSVGRKSFGELIDVRLPENEEKIIKDAILEHGRQQINFHDLRTRKAGSHRYIDLHLTMPSNVSLEDAHKMTEHLEKDIQSKLPHSSVTIHVEPCEPEECPKCDTPSCSAKQKSP